MTTQKRATKLALVISTAVLIVIAAIVGILIALNSEADPYETAWDNCIAMAEANPPADNEFPIPPDEMCEIQEGTVGREKFIDYFQERP